MEADQEILFAKTLEKVKKQARDQGNAITREQVGEAFAGLSLSQEQLSLVFDYLEKNRIGIDTVPDPADFLSKEEINYLEEYKRKLEGFGTLSDGEKEAVKSEAKRS